MLKNFPKMLPGISPYYAIHATHYACTVLYSSMNNIAIKSIRVFMMQTIILLMYFNIF